MANPLTPEQMRGLVEWPKRTRAYEIIEPMRVCVPDETLDYMASKLEMREVCAECFEAPCAAWCKVAKVNAALLQGAEALERTTWQPISTAPEATPVLVWLPNYGAVRAIKTTVHGIANWWGESNRLHPTHWQPLPAAPVGRTEEK